MRAKHVNTPDKAVCIIIMYTFSYYKKCYTRNIFISYRLLYWYVHVQSRRV